MIYKQSAFLDSSFSQEKKLYVIENSPYGYDFNRKSQMHKYYWTSLMYVREHLLCKLTTAVFT